MSETNGTPGVIRQVAARLRRNGQPEAENYMRAAEAEGTVEGSAGSQEAPQHHQLQAHAHQEAAEVKPSWGSNATLPLAEVERALLSRVQHMAQANGKQDVPADIVDFLSQSSVIFLDHNNQRVSFSRVVVTWEG